MFRATDMDHRKHTKEAEAVSVQTKVTGHQVLDQEPPKKDLQVPTLKVQQLRMGCTTMDHLRIHSVLYNNTTI